MGGTTIELSRELAMVDARYAELLQELAGLYQIREQLRRALSGAGDAARQPAARRRASVAGGTTPQFPASGRSRRRAAARISAPAIETALGDTLEKTPALRIVHGAGEETTLAVRQARKQGTRPQLRLVDGGRAAS